MLFYETLIRDHRKVSALLEELVSYSETGDESWRPLVDQIRDDLIPHSRAVEALLYNALIDPAATKAFSLIVTESI